jgi:hypothetical protein
MSHVLVTLVRHYAGIESKRNVDTLARGYKTT